MRQQLRYTLVTLLLLAVIVTTGMFIVHRAGVHRYSYLALGDSYTAGTGIRHAYNYPNQTVALLQEWGMDIGAPTLVAYPGWTTEKILSALKRKNLRDTFTFVSLLAGTNNQFGGWSIDSYRAEFEQLVKTAIKLVNGHPERVIVLSIPDYSVTPFAARFDRNKVARELELYNATCRDVASAWKCTYIDITTLSRQHGSDKAFLAKDGLHLSASAYREWAERIGAAMWQLLPYSTVR